MGDRFRFRIVADFIQQTFPEARKIADVAGGRGLLAAELLFRGLEPVIVEPRHVDNLPRKIRKRFRKQALKEGFTRDLPRIERCVQEVDLSGFDLIVGLHPDEATEPLVQQAVRCNKPFAVVPCCVMPVVPQPMSFEQWLAYIRSLVPGVMVEQLPMSGANVVLYRRR